MSDPILLFALLATILIGGALFRVLRLERRRAYLEPRLNMIAMNASSSDGPVDSLRRSRPRRKALPIALLTRLDLAFAATGNRLRPLHLAAIGIAAAATIGLASSALSFRPALAILLSGAAAIGAPVLLLRFVQRRYQRQFLDVFPDALDLIVRAVRSGLPAPEAIELVTHEIRAPVNTEFQQLLDELRIGTELEDALQHAADRVRVPDFRFYVVALALQRRTGGALAETLGNLSNIIRRRKEVRLKARALSAESKASATVLAVLPFGVGAILYTLNPSLMSVLFSDPRGRYMLGLAVLSLIIGIAVMALIIRRTLRY